MRFVFLSLLIVISNSLAAQEVSFSATSNAKQVLLGQYFQVTFTLNNEETSSFEPPSFKNFKVVGGPAQSSSFVYENGQMARTQMFTYDLMPSKLGKFKIGKAKIKTSSGEVLYSSSISVEVLKAAKKAKGEQDIMTQIEEGVYIRAELEREQVFVGEQVALDFKLYTRVGLERQSTLKMPDFKDIFATEIQSYSARPVREIIEGKEFQTRVVRRLSLFPVKAGLLKVDPMVLRVGIGIKDPNANPRRTFFGYNNAIRIISHDISSQPLDIEVKPLPDAPEGFTGAVGNYNAVHSIDRTNLTTDDAINFTLMVKGKGDIKQVQAPVLNLNPDEFEVYDPKIDERQFESEGFLAGVKTFEYLILPKKPGKTVFTPSFTFFDTKKRTFVTIDSTSHELNIALGKEPLEDFESKVANKEPVKQEDVRFIKKTTSLKRSRSTFFGSTSFWIALISPFIGFLAFWLAQVIRNSGSPVDEDERRKQLANKEAIKRLEKANELLEQKQSYPFFQEISTALWSYISDKLSIPASELNKSNVKEVLTSNAVSEKKIEQLLQCLQTSEMALFGGAQSVDKMKSTYDTAKDLISSIDEEIEQSK